jgi:hypothetical protein
MPKRLAALSLVLLLCGGAVTAIAADNVVPPRSANNPVLLAQNTTAPAARGRSLRRPGPMPAQRAERRGEACREIAARAAGRFAELEVRLNLTAAQAPAFNRWRDQRLAAAKRLAATCAEQPAQARAGRGDNAAATPSSPVERLARQQARLERRLADIQAERPLLESLYNGLNAGQRQTLARAHGPGRMGMRGPGMRRGGRMGFGGPGRDGDRMFRRGPGGPGEPPAPPSQFPQ